MEEKEDIKLAFFLNLGFSLFEIIGGLLTHSVAIFSDAIHDFGDSVAIGISYLLEKIAQNKPDKKYTYGYKRYSVLGAFFTSGVLIFGSLLIFINAIIRLFNPIEVNEIGMLIFAIFGIAINGYAAFKTSKSVNLNEKSVNLHMLEDVLGWLAVLIGSLLIKITGWNIIDPILSIIISLIIGYKAIKNILKVVTVIADAAPNNIDLDKINDEILKIDQIINVHHIHVWSLDGNEIFLTMHVQVKKTVTKKNYDALKNEIKEKLAENGINHSTIEIEYDACQEEQCA